MKTTERFFTRLLVPKRGHQVAALSLALTICAVLFFFPLSGHKRVLRYSPSSFHLAACEGAACPQFEARVQNAFPSKHTLEKPQGLKIKGLVFFGRRDKVEALRCYIERNLVENGGWLDEAIWVVNTNDRDALAYLEEILPQSSRYSKLDIGETVSVYDMNKIWARLERSTMYVKVDDDVVWFDDDTIPRLVDFKLKNPNDFAVSANVINNPPLNFMHYHFGALHPYFPELEEKRDDDQRASYWQPSKDPDWNGPAGFEWPLDREPPHTGHRWLRVKNGGNISQTPVAALTYEVWGNTYSSWAIAAQQHYSFLENLEKEQLDLYKFNKPWNMDNERIRINFLVFWSDDILDTDPNSWPEGKTDEEMVVMLLPKKYHRPVNIVGEALAAHFSFQAQDGVSQTDLMMRYQTLAHERACLRR